MADEKKVEEKTEGKTSSDYKPSGKWASEAFDFVRLFNRVGNQLTGLVILQVGWAALLVLLAQFTRGDTQQPYIGVPKLAQGWDLTIENVDLTSLYWLGAVVILGIWFFSSGLYIYIFVPIWRLLSVIISLLLIVITMVLGMLLLPLSFVLWLIKKRLIAIQYRKLKQSEAYANFVLQAYQDDGTKLSQDQLQSVLSEQPKEAQQMAKQKISDDSKLIPNWPQQKVGAIITVVIQRLVNIGTIGLAPLHSYSYDEDQKAAKAPMQIFAAAIIQLRLSLKDLDAVHLIRFRDLPPLLRITSDRRAQMVRKLLGWDALLWGSYISTDPPRIWLNIEQGFRYGSQDRTSSSVRGRSWDFTYAEDPLRGDIKIRDSMVAMAQDDPFDAYIVTVISFILSLQARQMPSKMEWFNNAFRPGWFAGGDQITIHLIRELLLRIDKPITYEDPYPTPTKIVVDLAGAWIAQQIDPQAIRISDPYEIGALEQVAEKCVVLDPRSSGHFYRLAVIKCIQEDRVGALKALDKAKKQDKNISWHHCPTVPI